MSKIILKVIPENGEVVFVNGMANNECLNTYGIKEEIEINMVLGVGTNEIHAGFQSLEQYKKSLEDNFKYHSSRLTEVTYQLQKLGLNNGK